ncbi:MAG: chloramphenicol acetyltransferase [Candidatus Izemoplasmatales bacterium]|jgi:chloramphenicol O-acetyltransferase type A|nr:chloramphenicol acetyltransferase [Candidatus Izemoplasmatales bacterium]
MKDIDIYKWKRKKYYEYYQAFDNPTFSLNVNIDITCLIAHIKKEKLKFFPTFLYCLMKAINEVDEFKYRIRSNRVVLHDIVHPSFTVLNNDEQYVFCEAVFNDDFLTFYNQTIKNIEIAYSGNNLEDEEGKDDLIFISSLPWISFTGLTQPFSKNEPLSIPRVTFGKYFEEDSTIKLPFSIQVHHGLVDGLHVAKLLNKITEAINSLK